eukprot:TRINITY_DN1137_c3_g1_i1.p1 TRINITY_DN1137_c3_g1~~TRINITY_DN1137_c3_g1_i1.p1  ORF type:complete len:339 (+),score=144.40 TRINITY_DN1137_c3_g1_i1:170-1186(+)
MARVLIAALCLCAIVIAEAKLLSDAAQFKRFMTKYGKSYSSKQELASRFNIFKANLEHIKVLSEQNPEATFGVNKFTDLSPAEFRATYLSKYQAVRDEKAMPLAREYTAAELRDVPDTWDWRTKGAVTPVKNQGQCGSCWSFSTTGNIEGQWFLANHSLTSLSEQNLVDCDHQCMTYEGQNVCDQGCDGGLMPNAFTYVIKNGGIDTDISYPYLGVNGACKYNSANVGAKISNFTLLSKDETQIAAYLYNNGPVSIAADAQEWQYYTGGVFRAPCGRQLDHGILIVGYGTAQTIGSGKVPYWIVKNSWGADWGEQGYLRIERGDDKCGLANFACSAIV